MTKSRVSVLKQPIEDISNNVLVYAEFDNDENDEKYHLIVLRNPDVRFNQERTTFSGTVVLDESGIYEIGHYSDSWAVREFSVLPESAEVILKNEF